MIVFHPLWHVGLYGCGGIAFYTGVKWWEQDDATMHAGDVIFQNGTVPAPEENLLCGCCGLPLYDLSPNDPHH